MLSVMISPLRSLIFLVLLLPAVTPFAGIDSAWSGPEPIKEIRVLSNVTVNHKDVSLAEICDPETLPGEWKSIMDGLNIGDAPQAGLEKFIDPGQLRTYLVRLLDSYRINSSEVKFDLPDRIVVRRESTQITQEQIEEIFKKFVFDNSPWKREEINIQRVRFSGIPVIPTGKMTYEVTGSSARERFIGNVTATVDFYVNGDKVRTLGVVGKVEVFGNVYLASRPLKQNEIISEADLEVHKMNLTDAADRFATRPDQVESRRVLHNIGVHQPLELRDLDKPLVLKRGDSVQIVYDEPGFSVTAKGQANADGGVGDALVVTNVESKKTIQCRVVDARTVSANH
ncbi:MAG: flagellar basal body P-ring formation chaperone FlgA [Syntrophobacteraceae bacterium]|jgi:flagella basal body P-ring formation protein FlgA